MEEFNKTVRVFMACIALVCFGVEVKHGLSRVGEGLENMHPFEQYFAPATTHTLVEGSYFQSSETAPGINIGPSGRETAPLFQLVPPTEGNRIKDGIKTYP